MDLTTGEQIEELRHIRSVTPDTDPWEASTIDFLLAQLDLLQAKLDKRDCEMELRKIEFRQAIELYESERKLFQSEHEYTNKLEDALRFYVHESNWEYSYDKDGSECHSQVQDDLGKTTHKILGQE